MLMIEGKRFLVNVVYYIEKLMRVSIIRKALKVSTKKKSVFSISTQSKILTHFNKSIQYKYVYLCIYTVAIMGLYRFRRLYEIK
jgi:hypothetical protein